MGNQFDIGAAEKLARSVTTETLHGPLPLTTSMELATHLLTAVEIIYELIRKPAPDDEELPEGLASGYWIHLVGPDDLIAAPDELTALRHANGFNIAIEKQRRKFANNPNQPFAVAVVRKQ